MQNENPMKVANVPIDIVYTWVDDQLPGYRNQLQQYAKSKHDTNPNRTRNNLDILKYSLRSVEKYTPWIRNIYIITCRPQAPKWLGNTSNRIKLIHHDEIIPNEYLPTFNSFCIVSFMHRIQGLSEYFLYIEDDMLFGNPTELDDFISLSGNKLLVHPRIIKTTSAAKRNDNNQGPWDLALAYCNQLLNMSFGERNRHSINHVPLLIEKKTWGDMIEKWADSFEITRQSRFRSKLNVAPEYLYPYYMFYTEKANMTGIYSTYKKTFYLGLENNSLLTAAGLAMIKFFRPKMYCLNDNFGNNPDAGIVKMARKFLDDYYPGKSSFEI
jgi:hypothetical protein